MRSISLKAEIEAVFVVTLAYVALFAVTFLFVMPVQGAYFHWLPMNISLLFLPHGVRLLSIYIFGWKALFYLLPGHILTWAYQSFMLGSEQDILSAIVSITASFFAVCLVFRTWTRHSESELRSHWQLILIAGALASIGNGLGHAFIYGGQLDVTWLTLVGGYVVGDVTGLFVLLMALIFVSRWYRIWSNKV
jgi:hypothetical protein